MSNSIFTDGLTPAVPPAADKRSEQPAAQASGEGWHSAFEHALGSSFERWFQAPTARGDSLPDSPRPAFAPPAPRSQPAGSLFGQKGAPAGATASARTASSSSPARASSSRPAADPATFGAADSTATALSAPAPTTAGTAATPVLSSAMTQALASTLGSLLQMTAVVDAGVPLQATVGAMATSQAATVRVSAAPGGAGEADVEADLGVDDVPDPKPASTAATVERDPLRVHAEWSEAGVRVWLGADAQGLAAIDAVTRQLQQWLGSQGARLLGVVCNGKDVWPRAPGANAAADTHSRLAAPSDARGLPVYFQPDLQLNGTP